MQYSPNQTSLLEPRGTKGTAKFNNLVLRDIKNTSFERMDNPPFSSRSGIFCFTFKTQHNRCNIWSRNIRTLLRLFFSTTEGEIIYFPPEGKEIVVFGRAI